MKEIISVFPARLRTLCQQSFGKEIEPEEIRLRVGQPVMVIGKTGEYFWKIENEQFEQGSLSKRAEDAYLWREEDMKEILSRMSQYSMYALEEEIRRGFFTMQGGHRIGIVGKAVCEQGKIAAMRNISGVNIRIAREKKGCAGKMLSYIREGEKIHNTLILSPPGVGKTTMLRDCIRMLSNGDESTAGKKVGVVDERSEIAASFQGIPQNDLGIRTDVLPKGRRNASLTSQHVTTDYCRRRTGKPGGLSGSGRGTSLWMPDSWNDACRQNGRTKRKSISFQVAGAWVL